jgi:hypothetical protein
MKKVAQHYFTHISVWTYIVIGIGIGYLCFNQMYFKQFWYVSLIPIGIAPFFEWFAHKYILHMQIGNVIEIPYNPTLTKGQWIEQEYHGEIKKMQVLKIAEDKTLIGYGRARNLKPLRDFMSVLHYGHHEEPTDIPLIFAPILSVLILFSVMFGLALLFTFNIGIASTFLFGVIIYYLHYEWMHLGHHIPGYKHLFPWSNKLKTAHQLHHYRNENYWWGITNSIGDKVLGTYKDHKEVPMSKSIKHINYK